MVKDLLESQPKKNFDNFVCISYNNTHRLRRHHYPLKRCPVKHVRKEKQMSNSSIRYPTASISDLESTEVVALSNDLIINQPDSTRKTTLASILSSLGIMRCIFFSKGGALESQKDTAFCEEDGKLYIWNGPYPKLIEAGSTPETSGGVGPGAWVSTGADASFVRIWKYRAVIDGETTIQIPTDIPVVNVQTIYVQGLRQDLNEGFTYNANNHTITLADELEAGDLVTVIIGIADLGTGIDIFAALKGTDGASNVGTSSGGSVQDVLDNLLLKNQQLTDKLASNNGASNIGTLDGITVEDALSNNAVNTREHWRRQLSDAGLNLVDGSFEEGATVNSKTDAVWYITGGQCYTWGGAFPKSVPAGSTPSSTGWEGPGAWISLSDATLRTLLSSETGYSAIGGFESVSDLRANPVNTGVLSTGDRVYVKSYYNGLGYGGGFFRWDASSTDADDGGYTIKPTGNAGTGRWKREFVSAYSVRTVSPLEFGAKMNDSTFDSAPAINAAISYLNPYLDTSYDSHQGGDVIFPAGLLYINDTIYGAPNVRILGTGGSPGFRFSRAGCACIAAMSTMETSKIMFDTAPWLKDNSKRYTTTDEMLYGRTESDGYYGATLENIVFIGLADTQCGVRIWRVPASKLNKVAVYNCKVGYWFSGSWDISMRDCFALGAKYATFLVYQCTAIRIGAGYFTGNTSFLFADGTQQWFHRSISDSNRPNIAYVTTFMYAYNSFDIDLYGVTKEGYNRPFALFYCGNVNEFGGYAEHLAPPSSETGHRVYVQCVASTFFSNGVYFNHDNMDLVVQSGNTTDGTSGEYVTTEISKVHIIHPRMVTKFVNITKDLGYGSYNIAIDCQHYITQSLATTLAALRNYTVQFNGLLDQYTMRIPNITPNGTTSFSFTISNLIAAGDYEVHFILRNVATTVHQDIRFNMLIGSTVGISNYEARSRTGTATFPAPTVTYDNAGTATITFQGNSGNYSVYRVKCVPRENKPLYVP